MDNYGVLSLLPVAVMLAVAIITKKTTSSLIISSLVAFVILAGPHFLGRFVEELYTVGMDGDTVWMVLIYMFIGATAGLLSSIGATGELIKILEKRAHSNRQIFLWTWLLSAVCFIDDSLRMTMLGQLTPMYDKVKIPRASLAYMNDVTGVSFAALIPITSWAVFYYGVFGDYEQIQAYGSNVQWFVKTIPFNFYPIVALIICFLFTMGLVPKLGQMKKVYKRAEETGKLYSPEAEILNQNPVTVEYEGKGPLRLFCFLGTLALLITVVFVSGDLLTGFIIGLIALNIVAVITRLSTWDAMMKAEFRGAQGMLPMALILFFVYVFKNAVIALGLPEFVMEVTGSLLTPSLFPFISFIICCILTFTTGSNWGTSGVFAAVAMPIAFNIGADPFMCMAAIMSGSSFGGHVCFYTDYTVLASIMTKMDNIEHSLTQLPYGLIGGAISAILFLIVGLVG